MSKHIIEKGIFRGIMYEIHQSKRDTPCNFLGEYMHCMYLKLVQGQNPNVFITPAIVTSYWDYNNIPLSELDWHGGVTFYEESINKLNNETLIKIGCDYQHYGDDFYTGNDCIKSLTADAECIIDELYEKFPSTIPIEMYWEMKR